MNDCLKPCLYFRLARQCEPPLTARAYLQTDEAFNVTWRSDWKPDHNTDLDAQSGCLCDDEIY